MTDSSPTVRFLLSRPSVRRGFSLVEAVISIGVVSFAMMGILGLVPIGLTTFRDAMNLTVESAIVQEVVSELQRTDPSRLAATNLYFDAQGNRVAMAQAPTRLYTVEVSPPAPVQAASLIAADAASTVMVRVSASTQPAQTNRYPVILAR